MGDDVEYSLQEFFKAKNVGDRAIREDKVVDQGWNVEMRRCEWRRD